MTEDLLQDANKRIADLERDCAIKHDTIMALQKRVDQLENWIRKKRDTNFAFTQGEIAEWSIEKDSFYRECTEILEKR